MSKCGTDIWEYRKKKFLILVDRLSSFVLCENIPKMTTKAVIAKLDNFITTLRSDGGRCYKSQGVKDYCKRVGIKYEMSSAYFSESDGLSEAAVGANKKLF
jgi:hypothetical protein